SSIADYFQEKTGFRVSEDEIGYIALHIIGALEKIKEVHLNIGIINPFDASLTKMIEDDILRKYAEATFTSVSMFE
ncbi:PRD domain-containing protein, partial [Alkalihalophilus lindianensis]